jgi:hypothetical protein
MGWKLERNHAHDQHRSAKRLEGEGMAREITKTRQKLDEIVLKLKIMKTLDQIEALSKQYQFPSSQLIQQLLDLMKQWESLHKSEIKN